MRRAFSRVFGLGAVAVWAAACGSRTEAEWWFDGDTGASGPAAMGAGGLLSSSGDGGGPSGTVGVVGVGGLPGAMGVTTSVRTTNSQVTVATVSGTTGPPTTGGLAGSGNSAGGASFGATTDFGATGRVFGAGGFAVATVSVGGVGGMGAGGTGGTGPCCEASYALGCEMGGVSACVCEQDPYCCDTAWDELCVREVESFDCGVCTAPMGGAGGAVAVVTNNASTATNTATNTFAASFGGAMGTTDGSVTVGGMGGTGGMTGACCEVSSVAGCEDPDIEACVCRYDDFCCNENWDYLCVEEVESLGCGTCSEPFGGVGGFPSTAVAVVSSMGGATSTSSTTGEGGGGGIGQCVEQSQSNCEACLCTDCFEAYGDCIADFGCPEIIACLDESGCTGADCVLACQDVIDQFGGLEGASVAYTVALIECAYRQGCPCD